MNHTQADDGGQAENDTEKIIQKILPAAPTCRAEVLTKAEA